MTTKPQDSVQLALRQWAVWDPYLSTQLIKRPLKRRIPEEGNPQLHHCEKERQCMYKRNIEVRSRKYCCHGKEINIYSKCVYLALIVQNAKRLCCSISRSVACLAVPYFPHYLTNGTTFGKKVVEHKMCVLIYYTTFVWKTCHSKKNFSEIFSLMYICLRVKCPLFLSGCNETGIFSQQIFEKCSNIKCYENPSSGSRVVPCGRTGRSL
jgi:hypothetical protein